MARTKGDYAVYIIYSYILYFINIITLVGKTCDLKISGCTQLCHETPHGYFCQCKPGYELLSDKKTCIGL